MIGPQSAVILSHPCFNGVEEQHESADWFLGCQWILNLLLLLGFLFSRDFLSFFASPFPRSCGPLLPQQLLDFSQGGVWIFLTYQSLVQLKSKMLIMAITDLTRTRPLGKEEGKILGNRRRHISTWTICRPTRR